MNIIVIAVVALLILVILAVIVLRGTGNFNKGVNACDVCVVDKDQCTQAGSVAIPSSCTLTYGDGKTKGSYCCTNIDG